MIRRFLPWCSLWVLCAVPAAAQVLDGGLGPDAGTVAPATKPLAAVDPTFFEEHFHGTEVWTNTSHYEVGLVLGQGGLLFADGVAPIPLNGVFIRERNGILSYLLTVFAGQALSAMAIASSAVEVKNVRTSSSSSTSYNGDGTRTVTTTTTTTADVKQLKSQEQVDQETTASNKAISSGFVGHTFGELAIYGELPLVTQPTRPVGQGYEMTFGGHGELFRFFNLPAILDVGVHFANVRVSAPNSPGIGGPYLFHSAGGLLARFKLPLTRFAALSVEWIFNFLSFGYLFEADRLLLEGSRPLSPVRLTLDVFATDFVFVRGEATLGMLGVTDGRLGVSLAAGVRL